MTEHTDVAQQLLQRLLSSKVTDLAGAPLPRVADGEPVLLTPSQAGIWFFTRLFPQSTEYNIFETVDLEAAPEPDVLDAALTALMGRHDALRLRIFEADGEPVQVDSGVTTPAVTWHDLSQSTAEAAEEQAREIGNACARELIRPDEPPLFRVTAIKMPGGAGRVIVVLHHLIVDDLSWGILVNEFTELVAQRALPPSRAPRFVDYAASLQAGAGQAESDRELAYWSRKLGGELPILDLPKDRPRPSVTSRVGHAVPLKVGGEALCRLKDLTEEAKTTLFATMLAAHKAFLCRLAQQDDLIVGTALAGRDHPAAERLVGCFAKAVALRTSLEGDPSYREAIARVHATAIEAQDHQTVPFERVVAELGVSRDLGTHPVFQSYFGLQRADHGQLTGAEFAPFTLFDYGSAKWDLTVSFTETSQGLDGVMECSADIFDEQTVSRFADMYARMLTAMTDDPDRRLSEYPLLSREERDRILFDLNTYERPEHPYVTMAQPFEEQVERTPDAPALVGEDGTLTYAELNAEANRLAHFLTDLGVTRGTRVALCLERGFDMVAATYAIAKCEAVYVPLDLENPDARIAFMVEETAPLLVLTERGLAQRLPRGSWRVVSLDEERGSWASHPEGNLPRRGTPNQLSHLLYTSGSTGRPKAVACPVDSAVADILWMQRQYPYEPGDATILKTSYGFDVSLWELFWPLFVGARLVVCRPGYHRDPAHIAELIDHHQVTAVYLIPTLLQVFLEELRPGSCQSLRWVLSGGEPITPRLRDRCHELLDAGLVNGYGPTETGCATDMVIPRERGCPVVPLGRPAANFRLYVLDENLEVAPVGVPGEAYLGAEVGITHGYFQRPALTAERYVPDPFGPAGSRMYRTGDICRYRPDGILEHLGRIGRQVKIRGLRVELADVEAVLCQHDDTEEAVALTAPHRGEEELVAFVVLRDGARADSRELTRHAARLLPRYMVPSVVQVVPCIPTTVNGKTDHRALLAEWDGESADERRELVPPSGKLERGLAGIFARVLGAAEVGATDDFFELGGHSLLVFKLIAACAADLGVRPQVADVFTAPTVRALAERLRSSIGDAESSLVPLAPSPGKPLVVFVHGASGSALPFRAAAIKLGDEASGYAVQVEDGLAEEGPGTIERMAERYVHAVDSVRGLSPVVLVGWSMGGCVALEMTRQWRRRGVEVAAVLMLDTWPPPTVLSSLTEQAAVRQRILDLDVFAVEGVDVARFEDAGDELERLQRLIDGNRRAYLEYRPGWFDGTVHLLRAAEELPEMREAFSALRSPSGDHGWGGLVKDVVVHEVPGNHFTLPRQGGGSELAAVIRAVIEDATQFAEI